MRQRIHPRTIARANVAGGVGHAAVQIGRAFGAEVYATDRADKAEYIRSLGATPIDHASEAVESYVSRYTHALAPLSLKAGTYSGVFTLAPLLDGIGRAHHGEILASIRKGTALIPCLHPAESPSKST